MALAVCLLFDARGERVVRQLWARLEEQGVRSLLTHTHGRHHPHMSYAVMLDGKVDPVLDALDDLPDGGPFDLTFHGVVAFPRGRACLAPSVGSDTLRRQEAVEAAVRATGATVHRHYAPGQWVPHCSLATRATGNGLAVVTKAVTDVLPLTLTVNRAALVDSSTGRTWPLGVIP